MDGVMERDHAADSCLLKAPPWEVKPNFTAWHSQWLKVQEGGRMMGVSLAGQSTEWPRVLGTLVTSDW